MSKFNIGDSVYVKYGTSTNAKTGAFGWQIGPLQEIIDHRTHFGKTEYRLDCRNWWGEGALFTPEEIAAEKAKGIIMINYIYAEKPNPKFKKGLAKKIIATPTVKAYSSKKFGLPTVEINGVIIPVIENFSDISKYCEHSNLFRRWSNIPQFLTAILGKFIDNGVDDPSANKSGVFGPLLGSISGENRSYVWFIDIYDATIFDADELIDLLANVGKDMTDFFIKDSSNNVYYISTDID